MNPLFTINFRREAYLREVARSRRRVIVLGAWVAYFGVLTLLLGFYGLSCAALSRRVVLLERQTARLHGSQGAAMDWSARRAELTQVERYVLNPRGWHDRLVRLATILPPHVKLTSVAVNPQNLSGTADQNKLIVTGLLRASAGTDRMQGVMRVVSVMREDSVFARGYKTIKLSSTRVSEDAEGQAEFVIECR
jgi:Tfp pilus assembly protein PilN